MRRAYFIAAALAAIFTTSFTAQEPPLAPVSLAPALSPKDLLPESIDRPIRLEFRAGKDKADHRILWRQDGAEIEAVNLAIQSSEQPMELWAGADGIVVRGRALSTVCQNIELWPHRMGADPRSLPSVKSSGQFQVAWRGAGRAEFTTNGFRFVCTKLFMKGEKNSLEMTPGPQALLVKTRDAEIRASSVEVTYGQGFRMSLTARTPGEPGKDDGQRIRVQDSQ